MFTIIGALATGLPPVPADAPPGFAAGQMVGFYGVAFGIPLIALLVLVGTIQMLRLKGYVMAMVGTIIAMIPLCSPCVILGIPFAIWCLVLLLKPEVKARFS